MRLVGGPNEFEGRVEVYVGGVWARWCHHGDSIDRTTIRVVCRQLGHGDMNEGESMHMHLAHRQRDDLLFFSRWCLARGSPCIWYRK